MTEIKPLSNETLEETIRLVGTHFSYSTLEPYDEAFRASLEPEKYQEFLKGINITDIKYVVAVEDNPEGNKTLAGVTGLYHTTPEYDFYKACIPEGVPIDKIAWVGYTIVNPEFRGRGISRMLLEHIIDDARRSDHKLLRMWTTSKPDEATAQALYDSLGFKQVYSRKSQDGDFQEIVKELKL